MLAPLADHTGRTHRPRTGAVIVAEILAGRQGVGPVGQRLVRAGAGPRSGSEIRPGAGRSFRQGQKRSGVFRKLVTRVWA
jgi:hypothetical protein